MSGNYPQQPNDGAGQGYPPQGGPAGGGFGPVPGGPQQPQPPQQPQQPGYGYPQQPAPPGYGYPQAQPGGVPPQQPGYPGGPQQPQPVPPQQPGYGYPPQPPAPTTPFPGSPGAGAPGGPGAPRRSRKPLYGILAAVLVIVLAGGGYLLFAKSGGGDKPKAAPKPSYFTGARSKLYSVPAMLHEDPEALFSKPKESLSGSWITPKFAIRGDGLGIAAYPLRNSGPTPTWTADKPKADSRMCAMGSHTNAQHTLGAALFQSGDKGPCNQLALIDLTTGHLKWSVDLVDDIAYPNLVDLFVGRTTVTAITDRGVFSYDLATHAKKWTFTGNGDGCILNGAGQGEHLAVYADCPTSHPRATVTDINPDTGKHYWTHAFASGGKVPSIVNVDPVVVRRAGGSLRTGLKPGTITGFDSHGNAMPSFPEQSPDGLLMTGAGYSYVERTAFVRGNLLVTGIKSNDANADPTKVDLTTNQVVAYNLKTGKRAWIRQADASRDVRLVDIQGSDLVGVGYTAAAGKPATVLHYSLDHGGKPAPAGGTFPADTGRTAFTGDVRLDKDLLLVFPRVPLTDTGRVVAFGKK